MDTLSDYIVQDTAGIVEGFADIVDIAGTATVGDMAPIDHSLFAVLRRVLKLGGHIRHRN